MSPQSEKLGMRRAKSFHTQMSAKQNVYTVLKTECVDINKGLLLLEVDFVFCSNFRMVVYLEWVFSVGCIYVFIQCFS